ncbi:lytic polysaccharide monooxygenase [Lophiostoma macrostomum CBS 122681]|uniref:Lytic polysaccharide monooxygenase n=1 Tax=Lophiostoma macrostomum CBS 122681 TaxID=1314788 RepID=A0A6A6T598_9PLEO|nr:lytic polysaccharide monooxygenase [Lophiostoma macrostomum CBS 122681]
MRSFAAFFALTASLLSQVDAHGFVRGVTVKSTWTPGADPVWYYYAAGTAPVTAGWNAYNQDNGFVPPSSLQTADINCHKNATSSGLYASANAGDTVTFYWNTWADSHKGPIINYIAPCDGDCTKTSSSSLRWSKISQSSLITPGGTGTWVTDQLLTNNYTSTTVIPKNLKAGNYVFRHEIIALHGAQSVGGAQLYPQCVNFKVGGSGTVAPTSGVAGTSLYTEMMAGIVFNLYTTFTSYTYPGPALWTAAN